jgi:type III secretion protein J
MSRRAGTAAALGLTLLLGCKATLRGELSEQEANQITLALDAAGIVASKVADRNAGRSLFAVQVASSDVGGALRALEGAELPRPEPNGFDELYAEPGLLITPREERARWLAATAGELARSLRALPAVIDARAHLALPETDLALDAPAQPRRAAVLLRLRAGAPEVPVADVRALVTGAVDGLPADQVSVVQVHAAAAATRARELVSIGPLQVTTRTAPLLKGALGVALLLNLLLSLALIALLRRRRADPGGEP